MTPRDECPGPVPWSGEDMSAVLRASKWLMLVSMVVLALGAPGDALAKKLTAGDEVAIIEGVPTAFNGQQRRLGLWLR